MRFIYSYLNMLGDRVWGKLFRWWQRKGLASEHIKIKPTLRILRDNGWVSLDLLLVNEASMTVWVEEAKVILTDLEATWQTSIPPGQAKHEI
jgi:hypothetical protein